MNFVIQFTVRTTVELSSLQGVAKAYCDKDVAFLSLFVCAIELLTVKTVRSFCMLGEIAIESTSRYRNSSLHLLVKHAQYELSFPQRLLKILFC